MGNRADGKVLAQNKKASHDYFIEDTYECGIVLTGTEIKSLRLGRANIGDAFATIRNGEAFIHNIHISPFEQGNRHNPSDPTRARKLLLKKVEIRKLFGLAKQDGYALVPLKIYVRNGFAKLLIGLGKGKSNMTSGIPLRNVMHNVIFKECYARSKRLLVSNVCLNGIRYKSSVAAYLCASRKTNCFLFGIVLY